MRGKLCCSKRILPTKEGEVAEMPRYFMKDTALAKIEQLMMEFQYPSQSNGNEVDDTRQSSTQAISENQSTKTIYGRKTRNTRVL